MARLLVLDNVQPPIVLLTAGLANIAAQMASPDIVITHAFDGEHMPGSLHKQYAALDIRTKNMVDVDKHRLLRDLTVKFPKPAYDVLLEDEHGPNEHIHIEKNLPAVMPGEQRA